MKFKARITNLEFFFSGITIISEKGQNDAQNLETNNVIDIHLPAEYRTIKQNRALHLFFKWIAIEFNNIGMTFNYTGLKGGVIQLPYTGILIKETLWKPIQKSLFDIESTTKIDTNQINQILDVLIKFFGDMGIDIKFPNKFDKFVDEINKRLKNGETEEKIIKSL